MQFLERYRSHILLTCVLTALFGGLFFYDRRPQPAAVEIIEPTPAPTMTPGLIRVHVVGEVRTPGVYDLAQESRWIEAVEAAGGITERADLELINLAEPLYDGQQIRIPLQGATLAPTPAPAVAPLLAQPGPAGGGNPSHMGARININTASAQELDALPGIGPVYAGRIIAYREEHGGFKEPAEIMQVKGIGPACYDGIKDLITIQ